ncbi:hypothetical protein ABFS82_04G108000 [Erythranthe guttata]|uniref:putative UPF0481 protein At3g02645 n=1 Tax=Erythranthe guttata TaxID=4155 RepID=UPI00064DB316|nr:PREDICTED: putative UPF0481 protein At3g02645 [Erythranthe guttata]|eukprot:XP_012852622.1 PREDICTED: putative UPF0481 protein At3g02645 [Erythranthe guttata]
MSSSHLCQNPNFDEQRWIIHIRRALDDDGDGDEDLDQESGNPVSIFNVPKTLTLASPESYTPQQVSLGPYHHWRPDLYEMEKFKISAARRSQRQLAGSRKFHDFVDRLSKFEIKFRSCYHKYLNFNGETLAWMMAVDSCFLIEFLQVFAAAGEGRKSGCDAVIRDMVMLENQIPLFTLRKMVEFQLGSVDRADDLLYTMLMGFCNEVSPFKINRESMPNNVSRVLKCAHLLDFLYRSIVPKSEVLTEIAVDAEKEGVSECEKISFRKIMSSIKRLVISKPVKFLLMISWKIVSVLPGMIVVKQIEYLCFSREREETNTENENSNKHPLMEEITIPSVTDLSMAGVRFSVTNEGIFGISFDRKTATFNLPTVRLDVNTEVVMRNLVAYEACNHESGPLIFARYTELMNGIIDTEEDAKLMREQGIVLNHLKSDEDVANLWNGMSKSIRLTKVPFLDEVIEGVNSYYEGRWRVRIGKLLKRHVFGSWQSMTFLAAILLLSFMSLQTFCSLFSCARLVFHRRTMN